MYLDIYDYKSPVNFNLNSLVCSWLAENLTQPSSITGSCSREYAFLQKIQRDWMPIPALLTKDEAITSGTGTVWFRGRLIFYTALMDNFFVHQKPGITSQEMLRSIPEKIIFFLHWLIWKLHSTTMPWITNHTLISVFPKQMVSAPTFWIGALLSPFAFSDTN